MVHRRWAREERGGETHERTKQRGQRRRGPGFPVFPLKIGKKASDSDKIKVERRLSARCERGGGGRGRGGRGAVEGVAGLSEAEWIHTGPETSVTPLDHLSLHFQGRVISCQAPGTLPPFADGTTTARGRVWGSDRVQTSEGSHDVESSHPSIVTGKIPTEHISVCVCVWGGGWVGGGVDRPQFFKAPLASRGQSSRSAVFTQSQQRFLQRAGPDPQKPHGVEGREDLLRHKTHENVFLLEVFFSPFLSLSCKNKLRTCQVS